MSEDKEMSEFLEIMEKMGELNILLDKVIIPKGGRSGVFHPEIIVDVYTEKAHTIVPFVDPDGPGVSLYDITKGFKLMLMQKRIWSDYCLVLSKEDEQESEDPYYLYKCEIIKDGIPSKCIPILSRKDIEKSFQEEGRFSTCFRREEGEEFRLFITRDQIVNMDDFYDQYRKSPIYQRLGHL